MSAGPSTPQPQRTQAPAPRPASTQPAPAPATPVAPVVIKKTIKINKPDIYDGKPEALETYLSQMRLYFMFNDDQFENQEQQVLYATTFLRGRAYKWANAYVKDCLDNRQAAAPESRQIVGNYAYFVERLKAYFGDID